MVGLKQPGVLLWFSKLKLSLHTVLTILLVIWVVNYRQFLLILFTLKINIVTWKFIEIVWVACYLDLSLQWDCIMYLINENRFHDQMRKKVRKGWETFLSYLVISNVWRNFLGNFNSLSQIVNVNDMTLLLSTWFLRNSSRGKRTVVSQPTPILTIARAHCRRWFCYGEFLLSIWLQRLDLNLYFVKLQT